MDIPNVRTLEDLIIDGFYNGLLVGKLDQRQQQLQVEYTMGRDVRPEQFEETMESLKSWSNNTKTVLDTIDNRIRAAHEMISTNQMERDEYNKQIELVRRNIRSKSSSSSGGGGPPSFSSSSLTNNNNNNSKMETDDIDSAGIMRSREQGLNDPNNEQRSGRAKKRYKVNE